MPLFLEVGTRKEAEALAPGAFMIAPVRGGYMAYRTREEAIIEAARLEAEHKRLSREAKAVREKGLALMEEEGRTWNEYWALTFSCPNGFCDEDREADIVGEVKKKKPSKKASPKKARKPVSGKGALRVIPGGREASPEAPR